MPMPVISQPITIAPGEAAADMSRGRLKTPPPIIEPTTSATKGSRASLPGSAAATGAAGTVVTIVVIFSLLNRPDFPRQAHEIPKTSQNRPRLTLSNLTHEDAR